MPDAAWVSLVVGLLVALVGLVIALLARSSLRTAAAAPVRPIAGAPLGCPVAFEARVVPAEGSLIDAPFGNRQVVWFQLIAFYMGGAASGSTKQLLGTELESVAFDLDDGSGERVRVPQGAGVWTGRVRDRWAAHAGGAAFQAFLGRHPKFTRGGASIFFEQDTLAPNEIVVVRGVLRDDTRPETQYRSGPRALVMSGDPRGIAPLRVSVGTAKSSAASARKMLRVGVVLLSLGAAALALTAALAALGP